MQPTPAHSRISNIIQQVILITLLTVIGMPSQSSAQVGAMAVLNGETSGQADATSDDLQHSLDTLIKTLEDNASRQALVDDLKLLRDGEQAVAASSPDSQGLLGALADTFTEFGEQAEGPRSPWVRWKVRLVQGWRDIGRMLEDTDYRQLLQLAVESGIQLLIWSGLVILMVMLGRLVARRRNWPMDLPREPKAWMLAVHFMRRMLPWVVALLAMLGLGHFMPDSPGHTVITIIAYAALCGRTLSVVVELVISMFANGHRYSAVRMMRRHALQPLFVIGALVALGDAFRTERVVEMLGFNLASLASVLANMLAALLAIRFILRFQRPVKHLIRNRSYSVRSHCSSPTEVFRVIGRLWHIPALLMVCGSLLAIFITGGDVGTALARSIVNAGLLVLTLVATSLLRRQNSRHDHSHGPHRHHSEYRRRLERFGFTLAHVLAWLMFAELSVQVWGASLVGLGQQGVASVRIGQAILAIAFTVLLAWLVWIFADTAIQRALTSSARSRGRRVNQARAQTITPMIRNVIFITIVIIATIVGLANLGVNVTPLLAGAGVIGLAIGFGAQTLVQDLITGIFILIEDSLAVDDFVKINSFMGTVEGLTLRTVRLRDLDGVVHILTFSRIESIHNMSRQFGIALMKIRIPWDMKIDDAVSLMQEIARDLRQDPVMRHNIWSPLEMQGIDRFEDGCAILRMRFRTSPETQWDVSRAFNMLLKQRMETMGVSLGMPRLSISMEGSGGGRLDGTTGPGQPDHQRTPPVDPPLDPDMHRSSPDPA